MSASAHPVRVLVIDDAAMVLELTREVLALDGYVVWTAQTAEEGLALAASERPAVILLDLISTPA